MPRLANPCSKKYNVSIVHSQRTEYTAKIKSRRKKNKKRKGIVSGPKSPKRGSFSSRNATHPVGFVQRGESRRQRRATPDRRCCATDCSAGIIVWKRVLPTAWQLRRRQLRGVRGTPRSMNFCRATSCPTMTGDAA